MLVFRKPRLQSRLLAGHNGAYIYSRKATRLKIR